MLYGCGVWWLSISRQQSLLENIGTEITIAILEREINVLSSRPRSPIISLGKNSVVTRISLSATVSVQHVVGTGIYITNTSAFLLA